MSHRRTRLASALLLALTVGVTGCSRTQSPEQLMADAQQYLQKGDKNAAMIQLKNAVAQSPENTEARLLLAGVYNDLRQPVSAEKEVRKAISLKAPPARTAPLLAAALLAQGQFQKALDESKDPSLQQSAALLTLRGQAFLGLKQMEPARAAFEQALKLEPDNMDALLGMASHAIYRNDAAGAGRYVQQAIDKYPKNLEARLFKSELMRAQGDSKAANAAFDDVLKLDPDNSTAHLMKAHLAIDEGKFELAQTAIAAARKRNPKLPSAYYAQARLEYAQEKHGAAMDALLQMFTSTPDDPPALLLAGATQYALGSMSQAESYLQRYIEIYPDSVFGRKLMATVRTRAGRPQEALAVLQPALKAQVPDVELYSLAGDAAIKAKDYSKATVYFEHASTLAPNQARLHEGLAVSALGLGKSDRAIKELESAFALDQKSGQAGVLLVMTQLRLKEIDKAYITATALSKGQPGNPIGPYLMGMIDVVRKNSAAARQHFSQSAAIQPGYFEPVEALARLDVAEGKPAAAKQRYLDFMKHDSKSLAAMSALAKLALEQQQTGEALQWLEKAQKENPREIEPAVMLAGQYLRTGAKEKALNLAKNLQTMHANDANVLDLLGQAQVANGDTGGALDTYGKLLTLRPNSALAQYRMAEIYLATNNLQGAGTALKQALVLSPNYLQAQRAMVALETQRGNLDQALALTRQIQKQHSKQDIGFVLEGDTLMWQKKPEQAVKAYAAAFLLNRAPETMVKLHDAMTHANKVKEADALLAQWQASQPKDIVARMYLASRALNNQQYKEAEQQYQTVLKIEPDNPAALNSLAWTLHQLKDPAALAYAEKAYKLAGNNPTVMDTLGWILVERGDVERGLPLLKQASALLPGATDMRYRMAVGLAKSGDKVAARKELQTLLGRKDFAQAAEARALLQRL